MLYKRDDRKLVKISPEKIVPSPYQPRREFDYYELKVYGRTDSYNR